MGEIQTKGAGFGFSVQQLERWDEVLPVIAIDLAGFPTPSPPISSRAFRDDDDDDLFSSIAAFEPIACTSTISLI